MLWDRRRAVASDFGRRLWIRQRIAACGESGQAIVLIALILTCLLGMAGLAIDYGNWMLNKREVQNAADAAALAAAAKAPAGTVAETTAARAEYASNGLPADQVTATSSS